MFWSEFVKKWVFVLEFFLAKVKKEADLGIITTEKGYAHFCSNFGGKIQNGVPAKY